jgi:hypothetical protein
MEPIKGSFLGYIKRKPKKKRIIIVVRGYQMIKILIMNKKAKKIIMF